MERLYRRLGPEDLLAVLRMNEDFRQGFITKGKTAAFLANPACWLYACLLESRVVGFAYGYALPRLDALGDMLYLHEVGVLPGFQRQGIGEGLMRSLLPLCRSLGFCRVFLFTDQKNSAARALYEKVGGEVSYDSLGEDRAYFFQL